MNNVRPALIRALAVVAAAMAVPATGAPPAATPPASGRLLVGEPSAHQVEVFAPDGTRLAQVPTGIGPRGMLSREGRLVVADGGTERAPGSSLTLVDLARLAPVRTVFLCEACGPRALAADDTGTLWIAALSPPSVLELRPPYDRPASSTALEPGPASRLVAVPGTPWLAAGTRGGSVVLFDTRERRVVPVEVGPSPEAVAVRPGTTEVWAAVSPSARLAVVLAAADAKATLLPGPSFAQALAFTPDGRWLLANAAKDRALVVLDPAARAKEAGRLVFGSAPKDLAVSPDGTRAAVFLPEEGRIAVVLLGTGAAPRLEGGFPVAAGVVELSWVP